MKSAVIILVIISTAFGAPSAPSSERIVGGTSTDIREYPYTGALLRFEWILWRQVCAGSLITTRAVLTASHCLYDINDSAFWRVRLGSTFKNSGGQIHQASQLILHEDYDHYTLNNDVAILIMGTSAMLSDSVQVVSIPPPVYDIPDNQLITVIGWGLKIDGDFLSAPEQLQHVDVYIINQQLCTDQYDYLSSVINWPYKVNDGVICMGIFDVGGKDACQGDSGGPVSLKTADGHVVIGIVSWGFGCAHPIFPGANARTSFFSDWIVKHAKLPDAVN